MSASAQVAAGTMSEEKPVRANVPLTVSRVVLLQALGLLAVLIVGGVIFYIWHQSYYNYSTDDAVVSGTTATAAPPVSGTVATIAHQVGDEVQAGQTIGTVTTTTGTAAVVSPITGTIFNLTTTPGELIGGGQPLAQVVDLSSLYITAYVDENTVRDVHIGQGVDVTVDGEYMHGNVQLIMPVTAGETSPLPTTDYANGNFTKVNQRVPVRVNIYGGNGHLIYPGESATVTIQLHNNN
jgi:multidrug resistance efflux pump